MILKLKLREYRKPPLCIRPLDPDSENLFEYRDGNFPLGLYKSVWSNYLVVATYEKGPPRINLFPVEILYL